MSPGSSVPTERNNLPGSLSRGPDQVLETNYLTASSSFIQSRQWHPTPILLPGKSHGRRSLVDYSPWGLEESDTTEQLHFHFSLSRIGEGNGTPLQCSCPEIPGTGMPGGLPSMGLHSRTRLK